MLMFIYKIEKICRLENLKVKIGNNSLYIMNGNYKLKKKWVPMVKALITSIRSCVQIMQKVNLKDFT